VITNSSLTSDIPLLDIPVIAPNTVRTCAGPGCDTPVAGERFCNGCFADAAKDCARQIEASLIESGFAPGSPQLKGGLRLSAAARGLPWYESGSMLGELGIGEACYLRSLTDSACLLLSIGGVAALANLPGTRAEGRPEPKRGALDFAKLPQWEETEPTRGDAAKLAHSRRTRRFQAACAAVMVLIIITLVLG